MKKNTWQQALSDLITDPQELLTLLELDLKFLEAARAATRLFPLKVPREWVAHMEKRNLADPLLQQVLPLGAELSASVGYEADPLQESKKNPLPGLLHKYHGRVLITLTSACAINCRFCFRRHFPYTDNNPGQRGWEKIFAYINQDVSISEVILSGGDPLAVSDKLLTSFSQQLLQIPHVKRLRIHTRLPIVIPARITDEFMAWIKQLTCDFVLVVHANHPKEIHNDVKTVLLKLHQQSVTLLNQSVLLKGINDQAETLIALSEALFSAGVLPYYLHMPDKVQGTAHFDVEFSRAQTLHKELTHRLPGYLVPKLVREEPGQLSKTNYSV